MARFKTDYVDDKLDASVNERRKYHLIQNDDGTYSLVDATVYLQVGNEFGSYELNRIHEKLNAIDDSISDAYDSTKTYDVGDLCIYDNVLYKCITAVQTAEEFNISKWKATNVKGEISALNSSLLNNSEGISEVNKDLGNIKYMRLTTASEEHIEKPWLAIEEVYDQIPENCRLVGELVTNGVVWSIEGWRDFVSYRCATFILHNYSTRNIFHVYYRFGTWDHQSINLSSITALLPTIQDFSGTTGTGNGAGIIRYNTESVYTRAVVTNIDRDDYFVTTVRTRDAGVFDILVVSTQGGQFADNVTINGTIMLYKDY